MIFLRLYILYAESQIPEIVLVALFALMIISTVIVVSYFSWRSLAWMIAKVKAYVV